MLVVSLSCFKAHVLRAEEAKHRFRLDIRGQGEGSKGESGAIREDGVADWLLDEKEDIDISSNIGKEKEIRESLAEARQEIERLAGIKMVVRCA